MLTYRYAKFHASTTPGNVLDHISPDVRGPWHRPWTEILCCRTFSFSFMGSAIGMPTFTLLQYREVLLTIFRPSSGAPDSAPGHTFWVFSFFMGCAIGMPNFTLLRYL